jgi:hypothetical protein
MSSSRKKSPSSRILRTARLKFSSLPGLVDSIITEERLRLYPLVFIVASMVAIAISSIVRIADPTIQGAFLPDYLAHWTGGGLLLSADKSTLYDPETQFALQRKALGTEVGLSWFVSPPFVAAFYAPFALLPYNISGILWLILSTALLVWCALSLKSLAPTLMRRRRNVVIPAVLATAPVFELLGGGQDSAFILAVWLVGIRLLKSKHNVWAGAVLALGFAKPQLIVLVPLVLLAARNFRALASFSAVCGLLLGISIGLVGVDGLLQWLEALSSPLYIHEVQDGQSWKMLGLPSFVQGLLPPTLGSQTAPILMWSSLPIGASVLLFCLRKANLGVKDTRAVWIATLATTTVFSPHFLTYDAVLLIPVMAYLFEVRPSRFIRVSAVIVFGLLWLTPVFHLAATQLPWPLSMIDAPWAAIPMAAIWLESLRALQGRVERIEQESTAFTGRSADTKDAASDDGQKRE